LNDFKTFGLLKKGKKKGNKGEGRNKKESRSETKKMERMEIGRSQRGI
jgi:hypothetical protein